MSGTETYIENQPVVSPFVTLIVPVTGHSRALSLRLESLANQHYENFNIIIVLQDENDPAVPVVEEITAAHKKVSRYYSGRATRCSQKNHNLIEGVRRAGSLADILVFCDSGHIASRGWLQGLLQPLLSDESCRVSSGYHQVECAESSLSTQGWAVCVHFLGLVRKLPSLGQPWGGATAIRKELFEHIEAGDLWSTNVVDDVSLAELLQRRNIPVAIVDTVDLRTYLENVRPAEWTRWLTRQWAYLKFVFPGTWMAAGLFCWLATLFVTVSIFICTTDFYFFYPEEIFYAGLSINSLFLLFSLYLYISHPSPGACVSWLPATIAALLMGAYCHFRTWFSTSIIWAGVSYEVGRKGRVKSIIRDDMN